MERERIREHFILTTILFSLISAFFTYREDVSIYSKRRKRR